MHLQEIADVLSELHEVTWKEGVDDPQIVIKPKRNLQEEVDISINKWSLALAEILQTKGMKTDSGLTFKQKTDTVNLTITLYHNGTILFQGKECSHWLHNHLEVLNRHFEINQRTVPIAESIPLAVAMDPKVKPSKKPRKRPKKNQEVEYKLDASNHWERGRVHSEQPKVTGRNAEWVNILDKDNEPMSINWCQDEVFFEQENTEPRR